MFKKVGGLLVVILGLVLLVYSATRSVDFISLTLPPDRQILAWFGLAALDGGLIAWLLAYLYGSRGGWQRGISLLMIIVDLLGCVLMFTADSVYNTGQSGLTAALSGDVIFSLVLGLSGIIALNIAAVVAHHLTDPDRLKSQAKEEALGRIEDKTLERINGNADQLAAQLAPLVAGDWMEEVRAQYLAGLRGGGTTGGVGTLPAGGRVRVEPVRSPALPAAASDDMSVMDLTREEVLELKALRARRAGAGVPAAVAQNGRVYNVDAGGADLPKV
jgi:hypothetical protein